MSRRGWERAVGAALPLLLIVGGRPGPAFAEPECPAPRVLVVSALDASGNLADGSPIDPQRHRFFALANAVENEIIANNRADIRFFSTFSSSVAITDVDYELTVEADSTEGGVRVSLGLVDQNARTVLRRSEGVGGTDWVLHSIDLAQQVAATVTPMIRPIREHQRRMRATTSEAIHAGFSLQAREIPVELRESKEVSFVLQDCDGEPLPSRGVALQLEGPGRLKPHRVTTDERGRARFTYTAPDENARATVVLAHRYEDAAGNDGIVATDAVVFRTSGKLWLLIDHRSRGAEIIVVAEHNGSLESHWDQDNTRGGFVVASTSDPDEELWSSSVVGFLEMQVVRQREGRWATVGEWFPAPATITTAERGGYAVDIAWPIEGGGTVPVHGTITYRKPAGFDAARQKFLRAKRAIR